jgi:hypothetical protein
VNVPDAGSCPRQGVPAATLDEQIASECANRRMGFGQPLVVWVSTNECGGLMALLEQDGVDTQTMYLYDPTTRACVEKAGGANGWNECIASASGVPLATSCTYVMAYGPPITSGSGFHWVDACPSDGGTPGDN